VPFLWDALSEKYAQPDTTEEGDEIDEINLGGGGRCAPLRTAPGHRESHPETAQTLIIAFPHLEIKCRHGTAREGCAPNQGRFRGFRMKKTSEGCITSLGRAEFMLDYGDST
jgi:hypothetical protein